MGAGVGVALALEAARTIKLDHVAFVPLTDPAPVLPVSLVWRRTDDWAALNAVLAVAEDALPTPTDRVAARPDRRRRFS